MQNLSILSRKKPAPQTRDWLLKLESGNELSGGIDRGIEGIEDPVHEGHDLAAGAGLVGLKGAVVIDVYKRQTAFFRR